MKEDQSETKSMPSRSKTDEAENQNDLRSLLDRSAELEIKHQNEMIERNNFIDWLRDLLERTSDEPTLHEVLVYKSVQLMPDPRGVVSKPGHARRIEPPKRSVFRRTVRIPLIPTKEMTLQISDAFEEITRVYLQDGTAEICVYVKMTETYAQETYDLTCESLEQKGWEKTLDLDMKERS